MKKILRKDVIVLCLVILTLSNFTGCSTDDKNLKDDGQQAASKEELVNTRVTGQVTLTVKGFEPDYVSDDTSPTMAVVHSFQSKAFLLYQNYTASDKLVALEEGKSYVFVVKDKNIGKLTREQFEAGCPPPNVAIGLFNLQFNEIREAKGSEMGISSGNLIFEEV